MQFTLRPEGLLERLALWFNLGPTPLAQAFFGMMGSRAAMAGVKLGLFEALAEGSPSTAAALATRLGLNAAGTERLLESLGALELVDARGEGAETQWTLSARARPWLDPRSDQYVGGFLAFNYSQWDWWTTLEDAIRTGKTADIHLYPPEDPRWREYIVAMFQLARLAAPEVARALPLPKGARSVLDLAGAHGWFAAELCRRHPQLQATVIDLPGSARIGRELIASAGMQDRVRHVEGDLARDPLGGPHDAVLCFQIAHHLTAEQNVALLRKVHAALQPGGTVAILEFFVPPSGRPNNASALLGLHYFLTSGAATYRLADVKGWLAETGFTAPRATPIHRIPFQTLVTARRR